MPPLPPLRTRHGVRTEPHLSQPRQDSAPQRGEPRFHVRDPQPAPPAPPMTATDDDFPVLTNIVEASPVVEEPSPPPFTAAPPPPPVDPQAEEDELVDRITAHVLTALRPGLEDIVAEAVRSALQERPSGG